MSILKSLAITLFIIALLNFVALLIGEHLLGGDALNGHVANGHYFVGSHGGYTEVSAQAFAYSAWHEHSVMITHPLAILAMFLAFGAGGAGRGEAPGTSLVEDARNRR